MSAIKNPVRRDGLAESLVEYTKNIGKKMPKTGGDTACFCKVCNAITRFRHDPERITCLDCEEKEKQQKKRQAAAERTAMLIRNATPVSSKITFADMLKK